MNRRYAPFTAFALILTLLLTSGHMAVARGQVMIAGVIVICTGKGTVTVAVDEAGQPTGQLHICPDCALHFADITFAAPSIPAIAPASTMARRSTILVTMQGRTLPARQARAPPGFV